MKRCARCPRPAAKSPTRALDTRYCRPCNRTLAPHGWGCREGRGSVPIRPLPDEGDCRRCGPYACTCPPAVPRSRGRPNPGGDERLRRLEREAALGDSDALSKARAGHYRTGRYHEDVLPKDLQGLAQQEFDRLGDPYSMSDRRSLGELMWEVSQATAPTIPPALAFRAGLEAVVEQAGWRLARRRKSPQPGEVLIDAWARGSWPEIEYGARGLVGSQPLPPARDGRQRYGHTLQESWWRLMCLLFERSTDRNFGWRECGDVPLRRNDWDFGWRIPSQDPSRQSLPQPLWAAFVDAAVRATRKRK